MTQRLIRIVLALAVAFVFTGRMEAAAEHCLKLAAQEAGAQPVAAAEAGPCHGAHMAAPAKPMHRHGKSGAKCECMAVLTGFAPTGDAAASVQIEPYAWTRPETVSFASIEPAPDWRPPRA
jgi:hypothetical protein